ncbi:MAG: alpha/beta hydrolase [Puia sp.]|nr:alpha/beta hydrolase [Puia sp.]
MNRSKSARTPCFVAPVSMIVLAFLFASLSACRDKAGSIDPVAALYAGRQIIPNIRYSHTDSSLLLDAYIPARALGEPPWNQYSDNRKPVLLYFHGGGFVEGDKISRSLFLMPYVSRGWCVVTADYSLLGKTPVTLPEIYGQARTALRWIYDNADKYKMDTAKIIVSGESAGGVLCLMTGFHPNDPSDKSGRPVSVAGIINWFGVPDLQRALKPSDASRFMGGGTTNADSVFRVCSPITYITAASPPVMTIHGDQDPLVPYDQALLLRDTLTKLGVKNGLFTVEGKKHGNFDAAEMTAIFDQIWEFLDEIKVSSPLPRVR